MAPFRGAVFLALLAGVAAKEVTPIDKVIDLIEGLKKEVEKDGRDEAKNYDEFACFCKDETDARSKSVIKEEDNINELSADIAEKTKNKENDQKELAKRQGDQEKHKSDLQATNVRCAKEKAEYEAAAADLSKAIQGLEDAIKSMDDSKPASFLAVRETLSKALVVADILNLPAKHNKVMTLLQQGSAVDPADPEYKFHSQDIIDLCNDLLKEYRGNKEDLDEEYEKTSKACDALKASLRGKIKANGIAMDKLEENIQKLKKEIAEDRESLIGEQAALEDDKLYLTDLQARCEARAHDYDQRSAQRGAELTALTTALKVLTGDVKGRADEVNERALLLQKPRPVAEAAPAVSAKMTKTAKPALKSISFLQETSKDNGMFLSRSNAERVTSALDVLKREGQRIGSLSLISLVNRVAGDPFKKVKGLIQKLIERLLEESKNEATKKGFCDTELGKAEHDRDYRFSEAKDLAAEISKLQAKRDALNEEIDELTEDIKREKKALKEETKSRKKEKDANMETLKTAKEGYEACQSALLTLKTFYKQAAKAAFVQVRASPVDEDTDGPGFSGNYKGKQGGMKAVFALLDTIISDFDRTLRTTEEAEHNAHREFVEFDQTSKSSIAGKETKKKLDEQDLKTTMTSLETKTADLQTAMDLLDKALQELEELKPTCMDTGMSYKERVAKREEEIKALNGALKILSP